MKRVIFDADGNLCSANDRLALDCPMQVNYSCGSGCAWFALTIDDLNPKAVNVWCKEAKIGYIRIEDMPDYDVTDSMAMRVIK
jgi:hypothetical protein